MELPQAPNEARSSQSAEQIRSGPGAMLVATLGVAALVPSLIAQSLPASRQSARVEEQDATPHPLRPSEAPALVVVESPTEHVDQADAALPAPVQIDDERADRASGNETRRAERKANRQAIRRAAGSSIDAGETGVASVAPDVALPIASNQRQVANTSPEDAAARTARRAQRKTAGKSDVRGTENAVTLSVPELPPGETSQSAMLEHVAKLSVSLNQAHRLIHSLSVEKLEVQKELAILRNEPVPETITLPRMGNGGVARPERTARQPRGRRGEQNEARGAREEVVDVTPGVHDAQLFLEAKQLARKRQMLALGVVGAIALFALSYNYMDWHWFPNIGDRQALGQIAYIGGFVQIFFMGWMFFRFARIGGKGARWLFPTEEEQIKQVRRRKQTDAQKAQIQQIKEMKRVGTGPTAPQRDSSVA